VILVTADIILFSLNALCSMPYSSSELTLKTVNPLIHLGGLLGWGIGPAQVLYLRMITQHKEQRTYVMRRVRFERTIPVFERSKTAMSLLYVLQN
jgi:hypothetical protein